MTAKFDMSHSGADDDGTLSSRTEPSPLLLHIEDRDLALALQNTRQIQANVFSFLYDFRVGHADGDRAGSTGGRGRRTTSTSRTSELLGVTTRKWSSAATAYR